MEPDRVGSHTGVGVSGHGGPPEPKVKSKQSRVNKGQRIFICYCDVIEAMVVKAGMVQGVVVNVLLQCLSFGSRQII